MGRGQGGKDAQDSPLSSEQIDPHNKDKSIKYNAQLNNDNSG